MNLKTRGNKEFGEKNYAKALETYAEARAVWETAEIRGHHVAVLWSNAAKCHLKTGDWDKCKRACEEGLKHFSAAGIKEKLEATAAEADAAEQKANETLEEEE